MEGGGGGESNAGGASARRQHKHGLSASSAFFQPALHSHSPSPEQGGSASQPGAARCGQGGRPPLGFRPQDPPEAPARGWPAHWETQPHTSRASHHPPPGPPTTWRWAASWLLCILLRMTQAPFQQWSGGKPRGFCAAQEAVCPPRGAPDSASCSRHLPPRVHAGQPQGCTVRRWLWTLGTNVAPWSCGGREGVAQCPAAWTGHVGEHGTRRDPHGASGLSVGRGQGETEHRINKPMTSVSIRGKESGQRPVGRSQHLAQGPRQPRGEGRCEQKCGWGDGLSHMRIQGDSPAVGAGTGAGQRGGLMLEPREGLTTWTPSQDFLLCSESEVGLAEF